MEVILWHHSPLKAKEEHRFIASIIHIANYICNTKGIGHSGDYKPLLLVDVWKFMNLEMNIVPEIMDQVEKELQESELFLSLASS